MITSVEKQYDKFGFCSYKIIKNNVEWVVPLDEPNSDYQEIQEWAAIDGNNIIDNGA